MYLVVTSNPFGNKKILLNHAKYLYLLLYMSKKQDFVEKLFMSKTQSTYNS